MNVYSNPSLTFVNDNRWSLMHAGPIPKVYYSLSSQKIYGYRDSIKIGIMALLGSSQIDSAKQEREKLFVSCITNIHKITVLSIARATQN